MIGHEVQGLQVVPAPVVGEQQVVHLAGKGLVGLEDEDVQHGVSCGRDAVSRGRRTQGPAAALPTRGPALTAPGIPAPLPTQLLPRESWARMSAPCSMSSLTISSLPTQAAKDKGCSPVDTEGAVA